jgi:predicted transcriptional regulator
MIERYEHGHIDCKIGRDVGMPESTVRNIIKHAGEIKEKGKVVSDICGLHNIYKEYKCYNNRNRACFNSMD